MKTRILTLIASLFVTAMTFASIEIDGIYYDLDNENKTADVTYHQQDENNYSGVTNITIPSTILYNGETYNVTSIGWFAFANCSSLTSITIPNSVTSIGSSAFQGCSSLTSIIIPNNVTLINLGAFQGCSSLTSITITNSATSIGGFAFHNTPWFNNQPDGCVYINNILYTYKGEMPENTHIDIREGTTMISCYAFYECSSLTSITIPNSVTSILPWAFQECSSLTSITIPNSVTSIGALAFDNCSSLTSITIPNSVTSIGERAFDNCSSLTSIQWNAKNCSDLKYYGSGNPFDNIGNQITSFTFGDSVQHIPTYLCSRMKNLTSITIPNSVTSIGVGAFLYCPKLTNMVVENGNAIYDSRDNCNAIIETLSNTLIQGCKNTIIPNSVTAIANSAFYECTSLTSITIPNSVTSIGVGAFWYCPGLTNIVVESGNRVYDSRDNCNAVIETSSNTLIQGCKNTIIPNSVTAIADCAFYECTSLTSITIPNSVTSIGDFAFCSCSSLTSVTIGNSVTSIRMGTFAGCLLLRELVVKSINPPSLEDYAFDSPKSILVKVPCGSLFAYQKADGWKDFVNFTEFSFVLTVDVNDATMGFATVTKQNSCDDNIAQVQAQAKAGYKFVRWSDGSTDNPHLVLVEEEMTITAEFAKEKDKVDVDNTQITSANVYSRDGKLHVEGAETDYYILDMSGRLVYSGRDTQVQLPRGVYVININGELQKVVL